MGTFRQLDRAFETTLVSPRFNMLLIGAFALVAIVLAAVGVYGVIAYSVASRTREIGVRMALGATPGGLVGAIVLRAVKLAVLGLVLGVAASFAFGRVLASFAYGVTMTDPLVLVTTLAGFLAVTFVAGYIPARRASRVDPLLALRSE
jgi:ABC-type antimicrobial peptide transport system permease subunit